MISDLLRHTLATTFSNRSQASWIAGSVALAEYIDRVPNDIDIHHVTPLDFLGAVERDLQCLLQADFTILSHKQMDAELEIILASGNETLTINWVLEEKRPRMVMADPLLGMRASFDEIIARKIEMYIENPVQKHRNDLTSVLHHLDALRPEINPAELVRSLGHLGLSTKNIPMASLE